MNKIHQKLRTIICHELETDRLIVRQLTLSDLDQLIELEKIKWEDNQAASKDTLTRRIKNFPKLCIGAFDKKDDQIKASLFMKPITKKDIQYKQSWSEFSEVSLNSTETIQTDLLFGTSLSSRDAEAVQTIMQFFLPQAIKAGWREIYLGIPIPGFKKWLFRHPEGTVNDYVYSTRQGLPLDPQLRHYHKLGFRKIISIKPNYFPHASSLDYGVFMSAEVPLAHLSPLRMLPIEWLQSVTSRVLSSMHMRKNSESI
jgi:hypothetical protein